MRPVTVETRLHIAKGNEVLRAMCLTVFETFVERNECDKEDEVKPGRAKHLSKGNKPDKATSYQSRVWYSLR